MKYLPTRGEEGIMEKNRKFNHTVLVRGSQHYINFKWRGEEFRLTGEFAYWKGLVVAEAKTKSGLTCWSTGDGDFIKFDRIGNFPPCLDLKPPMINHFQQSV